MKRLPRPNRLTFAVLNWWARQDSEYPYAALAYRKLRFKHVNGLLAEKVPTEALGKDWRIYLFKTGEQRDDFVEAFHGEYDAHGKAWAQ